MSRRRTNKDNIANLKRKKGLLFMEEPQVDSLKARVKDLLEGRHAQGLVLQEALLIKRPSLILIVYDVSKGTWTIVQYPRVDVIFAGRRCIVGRPDIIWVRGVTSLVK